MLFNRLCYRFWFLFDFFDDRFRLDYGFRLGDGDGGWFLHGLWFSEDFLGFDLLRTGCLVCRLDRAAQVK